jgi:hypothetical protein
VHIHSCVEHWPHGVRETMQEGRTLLKVPDIAASKRDANFVEFRGGHGPSGVIFFIALSDVTHVRDRGD